MRLIEILRAALGLLVALTLAGATAARAEPARDPEDLLGEVVVDAAKTGPARLVLPVVAVESPLTETPLEARVREVLTRDLELSGEVEVVPAAHHPVRPADAAAPVELEPWRSAGAQVVIRVQAQRVPVGRVEVGAVIHLGTLEGHPVVERRITGALSTERVTTHRLADAVLGALTGYEGPFASRLAFVHSGKGTRTVFVIDPDGHGLAARSAASQLAVAPAFDPQAVLYWAGSIEGGRYRIYREREPEPLRIEPSGSVYGLAFHPEGERVAVSIATAAGVQLFEGPASFEGLGLVTTMPLALHPAFSPRGLLAYAGTPGKRQRIYVDGRAASPKGLSASAPTFCRHPDGTRLVFSVGVRERADLISTDLRGGDPIRLTKGQGRNSHPACSPDGRLVAFFSTRRTGEGPGLYVMRVDGRRPRKISDQLGDSLQWSPRLPRARAEPTSHAITSSAAAATPTSTESSAPEAEPSSPEASAPEAEPSSPEADR